MNHLFIRSVESCLVSCLLYCGTARTEDLVAEVTLEAQVENLADARAGATAVFSGKTNLPPDSQLVVRLASVSERNGPGGSTELKVGPDGTFRTERFGPFPPGEYRAEAVFNPRGQTDQILKIVGRNGELLKGPLLKELGIGNFKWTAVSCSIPVTLGNSKDAQASITKSKENVREIAKRLLALHDRVAAAYAQNDMANWVKFARAFNPEWQSIQDEIKSVRSKEENWVACVEASGAVNRLFSACVGPVGRKATGDEQARIDKAEEEWQAAADTLRALLAAKQKPANDAARARAQEDARKAAELDAAKWRTWRTADGKHKVEAKFVKFVAGTLTLEKKDGTTVDVKMDILCPEDQEFVRQRKSTKPVSER
jgi:hypothetical protein